MPIATGSRTAVEQMLVEVTSLLLERARIQLEREVEATGDAAGAASDLLRMREFEAALRAIREERAVAGAVPAPVPLHREVSRFYEVPGQEDA